MEHAQSEPSTLAWVERLFEASRLSPLAVGALLALVVGVATFLVAWLSGDIHDLLARGNSGWTQNRDARLAVLVVLMAAAVATATRYHTLGTRLNLEAVARLGDWRPSEIDPAREPRDAFRTHRAALIGVSIVPLIALLVDRDPLVYFRPGYWYATKAWTWCLGLVTTAVLGVLLRRAIRDARHFSALATRLPGVDLLDPRGLAPFARQALRSAVPGLLAVAFVAGNAMDQGFLWVLGVMGGLSLAGVVMSLFIPLRGVRGRVRAAKSDELARVNAAIRGEPGALAGSVIARRETPSLADLLGYRAQIAAVPEWPLDPSVLLRVALYVAIPVASWVGGALVERVVDAALE